jgi:hypothetical protein
MIPGKMLRICTEIDTFVGCHGVESYKQSFRPDMSVEELLLDPVISRGNDHYEKTHGTGVTDHHVAEFIEYWGVEQYKDWCARDKTYDSIISNGLFASAQQKFLEKKMSMMSMDEVEPGLRRVPPLALNPYRRELRDHKGNPVPEPPTYPKLEDFYDPSYELYIQDHGIINYMLKINSINTLEHLLNYQEVARWQRLYISKLEYDDNLV